MPLRHSFRPGDTADKHTRRAIHSDCNQLVPAFLIHSFLYYVLDYPIVSDEVFDEVVSLLDMSWDRVTHRHRPLIDRGLLKTGFYLRYPALTVNAAIVLADRFKPGLERPVAFDRSLIITDFSGDGHAVNLKLLEEGILPPP